MFTGRNLLGERGVKLSVIAHCAGAGARAGPVVGAEILVRRVAAGSRGIDIGVVSVNGVAGFFCRCVAGQVDCIAAGGFFVGVIVVTRAAALLGRVGRGFVRFKKRIFFELFGDEFRQLEVRQLQQLDRLLQLRRHHQLLRLSEFQSRS